MYAFVGNDGLRKVDYLGMAGRIPEPEDPEGKWEASSRPKIEGSWEYYRSTLNVTSWAPSSTGVAFELHPSQNVRLWWRAEFKVICCHSVTKESREESGTREHWRSGNLSGLPSIITFENFTRVPKKAVDWVKYAHKSSDLFKNMKSHSDALEKQKDRLKPDDDVLGRWISGCPCRRLNH